MASSKKKTTGKQYLSTSILDDPDKAIQLDLDLACFDTPGSKTPPTKNAETVSYVLHMASEAYNMHKKISYNFPFLLPSDR